jgi:hydroxymethylbilane synthase
MQKTLKIGTRGSKLALWQANWVMFSLRAKYPSIPVELVTIKTIGDKILDAPLAKIGGKGLFVKEIEEALLNDRIDIAVHSMKDMPSVLPDGLCIGAIPERETPQDVIISKNNARFPALKPGAWIGTGSLRRGAQLRHARPDITIVPLRGNLDTRIRKLETEKFDAIVVAAAGLKRLKLEHTITEYLDNTVMLPAVGQGALCIEIREQDSETQRLVKVLDHPETRAVVSGERAFLNRLGGSCQVPVAGYGKLNGQQFSLQGLVANLDGTTVIRDTLSGVMAHVDQIGIALADRLLSMGADTILEKLKTENP